MSFYVYKTTNLINGKIYVGKHRWSKEGLDENYHGSGKYLQNAIRKYGIENFKTEILEYTSSEEENCIREKFWIAKLNTLSPNGYNLTPGGEGGTSYWDAETNKWLSQHTWENYTEEERKDRISKMVEGLRKPESREKISKASKAYHTRMTKDEHEAWCKACSDGWSQSERDKAAKRLGDRNKQFTTHELMLKKYGLEEGERKFQELREKQSRLQHSPEIAAKREAAFNKTISIKKQSPDWKEYNRLTHVCQSLKIAFRKNRITESEFTDKYSQAKKELEEIKLKIRRFVDDWNNGTAF